jgi:4-aminobutyrate aminotransferase-like enzyme
VKGCVGGVGRYRGEVPRAKISVTIMRRPQQGHEAVEAAIKFARAATGRRGIVYCEHAFHGLSYGALSLNGDEIFRNRFEPLVPPRNLTRRRRSSNRLGAHQSVPCD